MEFRREIIWNVGVQDVGVTGILDAIDDGISKGVKAQTLFCANPHSLVVARRDRAFLSALRSANYLIPDGAGIVLASKLLGGAIKQRVTGSDIMAAIAERWNKEGGRSFFFLGSSDDVLEKIQTRMSREYPRVAVSGIYSPPFTEKLSDEENRRILETIKQAAPTALWVGMTAPKQEKWVQEHLKELKVPFIAAVGAAFDYFAGSKQRASERMQDVGLEWLERFIREPRRMWRRNLVSTPLFLYYVFLQRLGLLPTEPS
jgi:N-acetylglucosaminyldiphosphoundecaprenol N-acetyl-beta-D-mannosaminyltransferase